MPPVTNKGRQIQQIAGITGVASAGLAIINLPVNQRYHRIILKTTSGATVDTAVGTVISGIKLIVNGVTIRDISPASLLRIAIANGYIPKLGELPLFFTEPGKANVNEPPDVTSWDLAGQNSFQIQIQLKTVTTPGITGIMEFDFLRNIRPGANGPVPFLQPVAYREFSLPIVTGENLINTIPFAYPIRRLWFYGSTADNISKTIVEQDGNTVFEAPKALNRYAYKEYGYCFDKYDLMPWQNATGPADLAIAAAMETPVYFDTAFISDPDGRWWKSLKCGQKLVLKLTSDSAQTLTVVQETMPGSFAN